MYFKTDWTIRVYTYQLCESCVSAAISILIAIAIHKFLMCAALNSIVL